MSEDRETTLYRHFDGEGILLYVGIAYDAYNRWRQHQDHSAWTPEVRRTTYDLFPTREAALTAEREAIQAECPKYNIKMNGRRLEIEQPRIPETPAQASAFKLFDRIVNFRGAYTPNGVAVELDMNLSMVLSEIKAGRLAAFSPNGRQWKITGWAIIDYLELLQKEHDNRTGIKS